SVGEISVKTGNNARNGGKNSLNRLIRCVCGKKIGPDPRNFNQRVSLGRNDLLIRTFHILHGVFPDLIGGNPTLAVPLSQQRYGASKTLTMLIHITPNCFNKKQHARCSVSGR
ncbi:hypothetical protein, partial [Klebsiella pneumoniae]|uniref:hypothetical protein n=1 Tax=Klebsiella pneumoniae TaxID=573 RepID=UPI002ED499F1|nr:hypothetical protein [Klebsiella pneumoniae]